MSSFERGETYSKWSTIRDYDGTKVDPATVKISIVDPCGTTVLNAASMTKDDTGIYYYDHALDSSATYGIYKTTVAATAAAAQIGKQEDEFFVMPWKISADIRRKIGLYDEKEISDNDLDHISWSAYQESLHDLCVHHYMDSALGNPDTGETFDGDNTSFKTRHIPIADIGGDGQTLGNSVACTADITGWWIDENGHRNDLTISISQVENGEITITQDDGSTAIPADHEGVYLDYWSRPQEYNEFIFREAVAYLGCHYLAIRLQGRENLTIANLGANQQVIVNDPERYYKEYRRKMRMINTPKIGGGSG